MLLLVKSNDCEQIKICEKEFDMLDEKIKVANHRLNDLEGKVDNLSSINVTLAELKTISKQQLESNKDRDELLKQHSDTLTQMNTSLINMNHKFEESEKSVSDLKGEIKEVKNDVKNINKDNTIKIPDIIKNLIMMGLSMGFGVWISSILK